MLQGAVPTTSTLAALPLLPGDAPFRCPLVDTKRGLTQPTATCLPTPPSHPPAGSEASRGAADAPVGVLAVGDSSLLNLLLDLVDGAFISDPTPEDQAYLLAFLRSWKDLLNACPALWKRFTALTLLSALTAVRRQQERKVSGPDDRDRLALEGGAGGAAVQQHWYSGYIGRAPLARVKRRRPAPPSVTTCPDLPPGGVLSGRQPRLEVPHGGRCPRHRAADCCRSIERRFNRPSPESLACSERHAVERTIRLVEGPAGPRHVHWRPQLC